MTLYYYLLLLLSTADCSVVACIQVISDRYQFPSLLGRYTDTGAATGSACQADGGVFAPDGCIASDTRAAAWPSDISNLPDWLNHEVIISLVAFQQ